MLNHGLKRLESIWYTSPEIGVSFKENLSNDLCIRDTLLIYFYWNQFLRKFKVVYYLDPFGLTLAPFCKLFVLQRIR